MKKIDVGQAATVAANVGVIVGILFLAFELRQNTDAMTADAGATFLERSNGLAAAVAYDRDFAELWSKGEADFASLDEIDALRLSLHESVALVTFYYLFDLRQRGLLGDRQWQRLQWEIRSMAGRQSVRQTWNESKESFDEDFQKFFDELFE